MRISVRSITLLAALAGSVPYVQYAYAQTATEDQLRSTIASEITADPRSQTMTQAQVYSMVNALALQAQSNNVTAQQLTYRPAAPGSQATTFTPCNDITCSLSHAFGLDGSLPLIPIALLVAAGLMILFYSLMRELGHPHAQI